MEKKISFRDPQETNESHRTALLDILCKIDVVEEIQSAGKPVIDIFDDIFMIGALFE